MSNVKARIYLSLVLAAVVPSGCVVGGGGGGVPAKQVACPESRAHDNWHYFERSDELTDEKSAWAMGERSGGSGGSISIACTGRKIFSAGINAVVNFDEFLDIDGEPVRLEYRVDEGDLQRGFMWAAAGDTMAISSAGIPFARVLMNGRESVVVRGRAY